MANSSSKPGPFKNVPPPAGARSGNAYTRFIPREELQGFESWRPGSFGGTGAGGNTGAGTNHTAAPEPTATPPTEQEWLARVAAARQAGAQEAYQNGYRDGLVALESFKQSFAAQTTAQVGQLLGSIEAEMCVLEPQMAAAISRAAVELARQVLRSELQVNPAVVNSVAQQAIQVVLSSARQITVQVHPEDLPLVEQGAADALKARGARAVANAQIARGGCIVESELGTIDARIGARWAQATASLGVASKWAEELAEVPTKERPAP